MFDNQNLVYITKSHILADLGPEVLKSIYPALLYLLKRRSSAG